MMLIFAAAMLLSSAVAKPQYVLDYGYYPAAYYGSPLAYSYSYPYAYSYGYPLAYY